MHYFLCFTLLCATLYGANDLDLLALEAGTDKSSAFHNYTPVYAEYFAPKRDEKLKFLEIGISHGNSVKLWENYFPNADLHFIDIDAKSIRYFSERSSYHFVDQSDRIALKGFLKEVGEGFDIIIDDGGHQMHQQIISFETLFPSLKSGGLYIIEDLHTSYWEEGGYGTRRSPKSGPTTCVGFLKNLIDYLNYKGAATGCANADVGGSQIDSIHFYSSLCIIVKK